MIDCKRYIRWLGWLLTLAAICYMIYRLATLDSYSEMVAVLSQASCYEYLALAVALVLMPVQFFVEMLRWQYTLRGWTSVTLGQSYNQVLLGQVAGFVTPYRAGDLPARLVAAGLNISREEWYARFRQWIKDWRKWFAVVGYTLLRHLVWGVQLWAVLYAVGISLTPMQALVSIALYYVVVSIAPVLPAADVAIKGGWAVWIFGQYSDNVPAIVIAVTIIWLFNTIIPVLFGSLKKILYFCNRKNA